MKFKKKVLTDEKRITYYEFAFDSVGVFALYSNSQYGINIVRNLFFSVKFEISPEKNFAVALVQSF